ncbi:serine/threonine-protein kinase [bacterium]|nr:serine/threonine-protein kinase [bacterium]
MIEQLGPYQILEKISKGGMGTVYKAYHPALDRHVAIKVLAARFSSDENFVQRFKKEARIVARLEHPHILPVYDFAFEGDTAYLVMKLVEGSSLYAHIGPRGMAPTRAMMIVEAVAQALSHAHRRNIIHRDIKPDNILIDETEWVYLSDFGMAKMVTTTGPTGEGTIMGTPEYMSPEQAQGKTVDFRSDIYSLTVLIFHILTGTLPFKGSHPLATIKQVIYDPFPEITSQNPQLPKLLDPLLQKGASKNPEDRFGDVEELVKMLGAVLTSAALPKTQELFLRKSRIAVLPFAVDEPEKKWLSDAVLELLAEDLSQNYELYVLPGDQVIRMCRNIADHSWGPESLQRFFELSRADYVVTGKISENKIRYEMKISTTFEVLAEGEVEGTIPFHQVSQIAQKIRAKLDVKEPKLISLEQLFHGNPSLLQQYAVGIRAYRDGKYLESEKALSLATRQEPSFAPAHIYLARALKERGFPQQAQEAAQQAMQLSSNLPISAASFLKAQYFEITNNWAKAAEIHHEFHNQFPEVIEYLVLWGEALVRADRLDEAANVFYEICEKEGRLGLGWQKLARIEFMQEKYEQAWYHYKRAQKLYAAHQHSGGLAATYMGLAEISEKRNEWNTAIDYYQRAVEAFNHLKWYRGVAEAKFRLALAYKKQGMYSAVLPLSKECLDLFQESGVLYQEVLCLREMLTEPLQPLDALEFSDRAIDSATQIQNNSLIISIVPLKLRWLIESEQPDTALRIYSEYYPRLLEGSRDLHFPLAQLQIGRALMHQERFVEAHQQVEQAIRVLKRTENPQLIASALLIQCELFLRENQLIQAHETVDEASTIVERLADKEMILEVDLMRARVLQAEGQRVKLLQIYLRALKTAEDLGRGTLVHELRGSIEQLRVVNTQ